MVCWWRSLKARLNSTCSARMPKPALVAQKLPRVWSRYFIATSNNVIVLNERHLKRLMSSYLLYYHQDRTHLGLATPAGRPTEIPISSARERKIQDSILSETRWPAPSLCGGSVDS